jgi:AmmeMemoRadiSam system protein A
MVVSPGSPVPPLAAALPGAVELGEAERDRLLGLARVAVAVAVGVRPQPDLAAAVGAGPLPTLRAGAFVTLTEDDRLRGCMGTLDADELAWASVLRAAKLAALGDPRFRAVGRAELGRLHLEVSILGPMIPLREPGAFRPAIDGLLIERGARRGLLLPEVAGMLPPHHDAMLDAVCRKAGLPPDAWRDPQATLLAFRTCRFGGPAA